MEFNCQTTCRFTVYCPGQFGYISSVTILSSYCALWEWRSALIAIRHCGDIEFEVEDMYILLREFLRVTIIIV